MDGQPFIERLRLRYGWAMAGANLAGGLLVFVLMTFVLPSPEFPHKDTLQLVNVILFVVGTASSSR